MPPNHLFTLDERGRRRELVLAVVWTVLSGGLVIAAYSLIGFAGDTLWTVVGTLLVGGALFVISLTHQFRKVIAADLPGLRVFRALGITVAMFLVTFAGTYLSFPPGSFSRDLNHIRALYFAITVLSTVGFGDITPETDAARVVVSIQMLLGLVLIGAVVRGFLAAAQTREAPSEQQPRTDDHS